MNKAERFIEVRNSTVDELDKTLKGLEEGVKVVCIGLNLHKFMTVQSCEGHFESEKRGENYPWIDLTIPLLHEHVLAVKNIHSTVLESKAFQEQYGKEGGQFLDQINKQLFQFYEFYPKYKNDKFIISNGSEFTVRFQPEKVEDTLLNENALVSRRKQIHDFGLFLIKEYFKSDTID